MFKAGDKFKVIGNSKNKYGKHCFCDGDIVKFLYYESKKNGKRSKKYIKVSIGYMEQTVKLKDLELL